MNGYKPKLSIKQMAEVMELRVRGVYLQNLAIVFGVSSSTLSRYIRMAELEGFEFWSQR